MGEMSSPDSLSPNRLNQALISETLSEFPHFDLVAADTSEQTVNLVGTGTNSQDDGLSVFDNNNKSGMTDPCKPFE